MDLTGFTEYTDDVKEAMGQRIQKARLAAGLQGVELAAMLNISNNQLSRIETGESVCRVEHLYVIVQILGCSADYLLFGTEEYVVSKEQMMAIQLLKESFPNNPL